MKNKTEYFRKKTQRNMEIMQGFLDGKKIQCKFNELWTDIDYPSWDLDNYDYRIKPINEYVYKFAYSVDGIKWIETKEFYEDEEECRKMGVDVKYMRRLNYTRLKI